MWHPCQNKLSFLTSQKKNSCIFSKLGFKKTNAQMNENAAYSRFNGGLYPQNGADFVVPLVRTSPLKVVFYPRFQVDRKNNDP